MKNNIQCFHCLNECQEDNNEHRLNHKDYPLFTLIFCSKSCKDEFMNEKNINEK